MKELLKKVTEGQNLTREEAAKAMDMMLEGTASPVLVSAFLTALRMKGETVDEIVGCTEMMKSKGGSVKLDTDEYIDFVGRCDCGKARKQSRIFKERCVRFA